MDRSRLSRWAGRVSGVIMAQETVKHYVFVDFENVQAVKLELIRGRPVMVIMVVGKDQTKVPLDLVAQLMEHSSQVRLVRTEVKGKNALDFVLSAEVGAQGVVDTKASFHIVSRDKGFDALVAHFRSMGREAARHDAFVKVPALGGSGPAVARKSAGTAARKTAVAAAPVTRRAPVRGDALEQWIGKMEARLAPGAGNRPRREAALRRLVRDQLGVGPSEEDIGRVLAKLVAKGVVTVGNQGAVSYAD
ncbi:MAG: hypothetical protein RLZZ179_1305 [Verrucomicrobiota bacterium]